LPPQAAPRDAATGAALTQTARRTETSGGRKRGPRPPPGGLPPCPKTKRELLSTCRMPHSPFLSVSTERPGSPLPHPPRYFCRKLKAPPRLEIRHILNDCPLALADPQILLFPGAPRPRGPAGKGNRFPHAARFEKRPPPVRRSPRCPLKFFVSFVGPPKRCGVFAPFQQPFP